MIIRANNKSGIFILLSLMMAKDNFKKYKYKRSATGRWRVLFFSAQSFNNDGVAT